MKKLLIAISILAISMMGYGQTTYKVATGGGVDYTTIAQVNAASFSPGDSILFNRGDIWRETLVIPSSGSDGSPIVFGAYGTGVDPIIDGSDTVSTWTSVNDLLVTGATLNGNLETWTDENTPGSWSKYQSGTSTITRSTTVHAGTYACAMYIDASNSNVYIDFHTLLTVGKTYEYSFWAYAPTPRQLRVGCTAGSNYDTHDITSSWAQFTGSFVADDDLFGMQRVWANANTIYIDDVIIEEQTNTYSATIAAESSIVFRDGIPAALGSGAATLNDLEWFSSGTTLYYRDDTGTPQGAAYVITAGVRGDAITVSRNYITIDGLHLKNTNAIGINGGTAKYNIYKNNTIEYTIDKGVYLNSWSSSPVTANVIENNSFNHNQGYGINLYGKQDTVRNNTILNIGDYYASVTVAHQYTAGIDIEPTQTQPTAINTQIYGNIIDELDADGSLNSSHGIYIQYQTTGLNIYDNIISDIREGDGIKFSGSGDVHNNIIYNCYFAGIGTHSYTDAAVVNVYYNLVYNCGYALQQNDQIGTLTLAIYNNTFYKNGIDSPTGDNCEIYIRDNLTSLTIKNNIIYPSNGQLSIFYREDATTDEIDNNLHYREDAGNIFENPGTTSLSWAQWQALGYDTNGVNADPTLTSPTADFYLVYGSPAINTGVDVGYTTDLYGNSIKGLPDIGAVEWNPHALNSGNLFMKSSDGKLLYIKY